MKWIRLALAMVVVGLAFTVTSAQSGGINVTVSDEVGPLPGAIVTVSHPTGFVKTFSQQTNPKGEAVFPVLKAGQGYIIEVSMSNYGTQRVDNLRVRIGETMNVPVVLAQEMVETVKVVAEAGSSHSKTHKRLPSLRKSSSRTYRCRDASIKTY